MDEPFTIIAYATTSDTWVTGAEGRQASAPLRAKSAKQTKKELEWQLNKLEQEHQEAAKQEKEYLSSIYALHYICVHLKLFPGLTNLLMGSQTQTATTAMPIVSMGIGRHQRLLASASASASIHLN